MRITILITILVALAVVSGSAVAQFTPDWESLDARPTPTWFTDAKFGIFIHWGVYSVPAWAPSGQYAEWYWRWLENDRAEPEGGPTLAFHNRVYGEDFPYRDFAPRFTCEMFDPDKWADLFVRSGAKYVVLTSKHHDGYCLWPSAESDGWNSVDTAPKRDLMGDLTTAVRNAGLRMGLYYSLYEWFHPLYVDDVDRYVDEHMMPQFKDVVTRYKPAMIFSDGEWDHPDETWRSQELLTWLFNESSCRDDVVVNDRWGKGTRGVHGGYFTSEYGETYANQKSDNLGAAHPWEESRGMGASYGWSRRETVDEYKTAVELIGILVRMVSHGGNLLLDIGPTWDGRIPVIMEERLAHMGEWLAINGEAIYDTDTWRVTQEESGTVLYTSHDDAVYAIVTDMPDGELILEAPKSSANTRVTLVGADRGPLAWTAEGGSMRIDIGGIGPCDSPTGAIRVFRLTGVR